MSSKGKGVRFLAEATIREWDALEGKQEDLRLHVCTCCVVGTMGASCTQFWTQKADLGWMYDGVS